MLDTDPPDGRRTDSGELETGSAHSPDRSLTDDVEALIDDGKTYVEAEIAYQKSRLSYAANRGKAGASFFLLALACFHLALLGLVVGSIIALSPVVGPLIATAIVVGVLLLAAMVLLWVAKGKFSRISQAFEDKPS